MWGLTVAKLFEISIRLGSLGLICALYVAGLTGCGGSSNSVKPAHTPTTTATATATSTLTATPTATPTADVILFSPNSTQLKPGAASTFTINMTALDSTGSPIDPGGHTLNVRVFGAPSAAMTPVVVTPLASSYSVSIAYNGDPLPNNVMIDAWVSDSTTTPGSYAIGQTLVLPGNTTCAAGTNSYSVPLVNASIGDGLLINAAVGYTDMTKASQNLQQFPVDTGSLGTIVSKSLLPTNDGGTTAFVIGPGGPGDICYTSDGNEFLGHLYLAPVDLQVTTPGGGTTIIQTDPITVLAVDTFCQVQSCGPTSVPTPMPSCTPSGLIYMGVGFGRPETNPSNTFHGPAQNAFLHVTDDQNGTDIRQGYVLPNGGASPSAVTLGITSTTGYKIIDLTSRSGIPGDWNPETTCYSFPGLSQQNQPFCGAGVLDVGIFEMFTNAPKSQWPQGSFFFDSGTGTWRVPSGTEMSIQFGGPTNPAASYSYSAVLPGTPPIGPQPTYTQWVDSTSTGAISVNTGINPLKCYNYMYSGQCGQVGFQNTSSTGDCAGAQ